MGQVSNRQNFPLSSRREFFARSPHLGSRFVAAALAWTFLAPLSLYPQIPKATEYQVKAAYLYNFGRFVQWPAASPAAESDVFGFCVLGLDPFGPALDGIVAGETIDGKRVVAKRLSRSQDARNCRVLFISSSEDERLKEILQLLDGVPVLTVSDLSQFVARGGMIQFLLQGNRVRFELNLTSAEKAGLAVSSDLLRVAVSVRKSP